MDYRIARAGLDAVEDIVAHRRAIFSEGGEEDAAALDAMCAAFRPWLIQKMQSGDYVGWLALAEGRTAAGVGVWLIDWPPGLHAPELPRADVLNVYTRPEYRRRGMARALMLTALDWCRVTGATVIIRLNTTPAGRPLYESLGFQPEHAMRLVLR